MASKLSAIKHEPVKLERRKPPTLKQQVAILKRQAVCAMCGEPFTGKQIEFDHTKALALGGSNDETNLRALCSACHRKKTDSDLAIIAKANSIGGKTGQQARRKRNGPTFQGRGFSKTLTRGFDGTVREREK
ncbi:MAG: HNH endonuclease signature motif containing protein [Pseudomonadota bacterium]